MVLLSKTEQKYKKQGTDYDACLFPAVYMGMGFVLRFAAPNLKMVAHPIYREISFWISFIRFFCAFLTDGFETVKSTKKGSCFVCA